MYLMFYLIDLIDFCNYMCVSSFDASNTNKLG